MRCFSLTYYNKCNWLGSAWGKIELPLLTSLTSTFLSELPAAEYLRETNISIFIYHSLMVTCSSDALENLRRERNENKKGKIRGVTTNYIR